MARGQSPRPSTSKSPFVPAHTWLVRAARFPRTSLQMQAAAVPSGYPPSGRAPQRHLAEPVQPPSLPPPGEDRHEKCPLFAAAPGLPDGQVPGRAVIGDRFTDPSCGARWVCVWPGMLTLRPSARPTTGPGRSQSAGARMPWAGSRVRHAGNQVPNSGRGIRWCHGTANEPLPCSLSGRHYASSPRHQ